MDAVYVSERKSVKEALRETESVKLGTDPVRSNVFECVEVAETYNVRVFRETLIVAVLGGDSDAVADTDTPIVVDKVCEEDTVSDTVPVCGNVTDGDASADGESVAVWEEDWVSVRTIDAVAVWDCVAYRLLEADGVPDREVSAVVDKVCDIVIVEVRDTFGL
eukprot:PhM_4_TR18491/c1_g4_i1/m.11592